MHGRCEARSGIDGWVSEVCPCREDANEDGGGGVPCYCGRGVAGSGGHDDDDWL